MGKKIIVFLTALLATIAAQSQTSYYFGDNSQLNKSIPTPEEFFGHAIGQQL